MRPNIIINLQFEAIHRWRTIPVDHSQQYLKNEHRHVFHITAKFPVDHFDRDIEFIEHKHNILDHMKLVWPEHVKYKIPDIGSASCEDLCQYFIDSWEAVYVCVLEDGENGAEIYTEDYK